MDLKKLAHKTVWKLLNKVCKLEKGVNLFSKIITKIKFNQVKVSLNK